MNFYDAEATFSPTAFLFTLKELSRLWRVDFRFLLPQVFGKSTIFLGDFVSPVFTGHCLFPVQVIAHDQMFVALATNKSVRPFLPSPYKKAPSWKTFTKKSHLSPAKNAVFFTSKSIIFMNAFSRRLNGEPNHHRKP